MNIATVSFSLIAAVYLTASPTSARWAFPSFLSLRSTNMTINKPNEAEVTNMTINKPNEAEVTNMTINQPNEAEVEGLRSKRHSTSHYTIHGTRCRGSTECLYRGYGYKWCYTSYASHWDYCCVNSCTWRGADYRWCSVGNTWHYCTGYYHGH